MSRIERTKAARAAGMIVTVAGRPLCATSNSRWLDDMGDGYKHFEGRDDAAHRIALCWNACRHLTDEQLAVYQPETPER